MTAVGKRVFSIEKYMQAKGGMAPDSNMSGVENDGRHQEIMAELATLKKMLANQQPPAQSKNGAGDPGSYAADLAEAQRLKSELKEIYEAIEHTKKEIVTLHESGVNGMDMTRVTDELGAIVSGTENATESILAAVEQIDQNAGNLAAALTEESQNNLACDIQDQVIKIFEACNFQDLTGQRITKVVTAFRFIEERVIRMMDIWGGQESFKDIQPEPMQEKDDDSSLLNGPALESDEGVASQDDIDALFN